MLRPLATKISRMQTAGLQFPMHQLLNGIYPTTPSLFQNRQLLVLPTEISREEKPVESKPSLEQKSEATATSEVYANNSVGTAAMEQCDYSTMKRVFLKQLFQTDEVFSYKKDNLDIILKEVNDIISSIVGMDGLKLQLRKWIKGVVLHERRKELELEVGTRKPLHMAFLGNPGTGKTMVARLIANILYKLGQITKDKVVEVQRTDLVGEYIGWTGVKTREKIQEAAGGILFVDEAYRLIMDSFCNNDFGIEALEEIMSAMEDGEIVVIFAGYPKKMQRVLNANPGFARRVTKFFSFDDYSPTDIATILRSKMNSHKEDDFTYGFMLHPDCTVEAIAELIKEQLTGKQIRKMNGGLVKPLLVNALENLDLRTDVGVSDGNSLLTITMEDLKQGFKCLTSLKQKEL